MISLTSLEVCAEEKACLGAQRKQDFWFFNFNLGTIGFPVSLRDMCFLDDMPEGPKRIFSVSVISSNYLSSTFE